ncbi:MAG: Tic22 family protein, partial [Cyanobacteria bacterium P01_H01_bin.130]
VATDSTRNGYLTLEQNGRKVVPFFFRLEDLEATIQTFREQSPENTSLDNIKYEVSTLGQIISVLQSPEAGDLELAERIRLIPSGETMRYIGSLQQERQGSTPQPAQENAAPTPSPTGAGALMP